MKKETKIITAVAAVAVVVAVIFIVVRFNSNSSNSEVLRAMYVPFGEDGYILVDQKTETVFTAPGYQKVLDQDGKEISLSALQRGDIVDVYGNGTMAESYPGQYMGVTKIQLVSKGKASDADPYQKIVDEIYTPADPGAIPSLNVEYKTEMAAVAVMLREGSYHWTWEEEGLGQAKTADGPHPLQREKEDIPDIIVEKPVDLTFHFSNTPQKVTVVRWSLDDMGADSVDAENRKESLEVSGSASDGWMLKDAQPGYVYLLEGTWEQGRVDYTFYIDSHA
ncbi:MAG: hypothetical protein PHG16_09005 [Lachnospiraceae bacterium]|nr:hypothetical protein [Lachnospiraceae bacterium]